MYAEKTDYDDIEMSSRLRNVLRRNGFKCDRCKRVMILKKYSEGMMKEHSENGTFRI